jgi:hypothetical protein
MGDLAVGAQSDAAFRSRDSVMVARYRVEAILWESASTLAAAETVLETSRRRLKAARSHIHSTRVILDRMRSR